MAISKYSVSESVHANSFTGSVSVTSLYLICCTGSAVTRKTKQTKTTKKERKKYTQKYNKCLHTCDDNAKIAIIS